MKGGNKVLPYKEGFRKVIKQNKSSQKNPRANPGIKNFKRKQDCGENYFTTILAPFVI
jgi:hypothetical protein